MRAVQRYFETTYFRANHAAQPNAARGFFRRDESAITRHCLGLLTDTRTRTLLDLGCGPGRLIGELVATRPLERVVGVDLSARSLELARARMRPHPEVTFEESAAESSHGLDGHFDAVVSLGMLDYVRLTPNLFARIVRAAEHRVVLTAPRPRLGIQRSLRQVWLAAHGIRLHSYSRATLNRLCAQVASDGWTFQIDLPAGLPDNYWIVGRRP